jgi:hypothetical protein
MTQTSVYRRIGYEPSLDVDRLSQTAQAGFTPINPTLARRQSSPGKYELFFHGNSRVTPYEKEINVSSRYFLLRLRRQWEAKSTALDASCELAVRDSGPGGFGWDYHVGGWIDAPGVRISSAAEFRYLQEFIVGVSERNDPNSLVSGFGGLYFIFAVDLTPNKYKIWMSLPKYLTPEQIQGAMGIVGCLFPVSIILPRAPLLWGWRYLPSGWQDYSVR